MEVLRSSPSPRETGPAPLRLFISYGHPESPIVQRICAALQARGHIPWFDRSDIRAGDDWRARIQQGVAESQLVLACLSEHSVRERSVCLDELAIAVGVKGCGCVHSILLGPEQAVQPPATVGQTQWLDMSCWQEKLARGPAVFEPWFRSRMRELFAVLESSENQQFSGQISEIRQRPNIFYDTSRQHQLLQKLFVGRGWLDAELDRWLDDPDGQRMCLLYGEPGVGKSAFAVHYTHYNPRVAAHLFCREGMDTCNDPKTVIQTLAYLLACRLPAYRQSLLAVLPADRAGIERLNVKELFSLLLEKPLALTVDGGQQTMVIVLDGLDECSDPQKNPLARTLSEYRDSLPRWLRILVTARPVAPVLEYTRAARRLELKSDAPENLADIRAYFTARLADTFGADPAWPRALADMTARSQGIFLYAELLAALLLDRGTLDAGQEYPASLDELFARWFS